MFHLLSSAVRMIKTKPRWSVSSNYHEVLSEIDYVPLNDRLRIGKYKSYDMQ